MQISGDDFLKKVQLKQEKDELEKKLNELDETRISMGNINLTNNLNNAYKGMNNNDIDEMDRLQRNIEFDESNHEFDNIMLNQPLGNQEDNKKKYLILGIVLVVLFLLTIIIIRLLSGDSKKEDSFTSNNTDSSQMKTLSENSNSIEDRYQRILDDRAKKDGDNINSTSTSTDKLDAMKEQENTTTSSIQAPLNEIKQEDGISNEAIEDTIKKIEEKKASTPKTVETPKQPTTKTTTEPKKSIRDLVEGKAGSEVSSSASGFFVQIGAFSKRPNDSYLQSISKNGFSYKIIQDTVNGKTFNKVLIGPYNSRTAAQNEVSSIKSRLNIQNTFIVNQ
ncbi:SPOR domain-containing protein [Aliarcobacter vitoriensis]|uniref:SPOR domain-containing protein n=1 Tax=Aliarcobacter vitoriensis TaxID=2011099 RepID=A0A366MTT3_9BACT|nr:SPOR domain-containing protein [Aliarcobacter vitoriensis]RBQ29661.1 SPOR domain-containing protein [Aliarcobacter vitoriensis]